MPNPFKTVENYPQMLDRIAFFTLSSSLIASYYLYNQTPLNKHIPELLKIEANIPEIDIKVQVFVLLSAAAITIVFHSIKMHDKISDLFRLRYRYDLNYILFPLAIKSGVKLSEEMLDKIRNQRKDPLSTLMADVFYEYVSSKKTEGVIDKHLIIMAMNQLSWYWVIVEIISVIVIVLGIVLFFKMYKEGLIIASAILALVISLFVLKKDCIKYTSREVSAILSDEEKKEHIKSVFNDL